VEPRYSIAICEFAYNQHFADSTSLYGAGGGARRAPFSFAVIAGGGQLCLVDTGVGDTPYQREISAKQGLEGLVTAEHRLAEMGYRAGDVGTVFITHAHYDHFGNVDAFPNAIFYVQGREVREWLRALALPAHLRFFNESVDPATLEACGRLASEGRLRMLEGDATDILPGIDAHAAHDTHTFGSMWLSVRPGPGAAPYILVGDNVYSYESLEPVLRGGSIIPIGQATGSNFQQMLCISEILDAAGGEINHVLPFHEGRVADLFPATRNSRGLATVEICR
jgi:glyoxylase-like metal-dependent hydrolase (beta-lactamase superfamily II)